MVMHGCLSFIDAKPTLKRCPIEHGAAVVSHAQGAEQRIKSMRIW